MSVFTCEHCGDGLATETLATTEEKVCPDCLEFLDPERSRSWEEMANLNHTDQVRIFGWCGCEDSSAPYDDCPKVETGCDEDKRELRACDCGQGQHKMIICLDCDDVLERDCEAGVLR